MDTCIRDNKEWPITTKYYYNTPCLVCGEILPNEGLWNDRTPIKDAWKQALNRLNEEQEQCLADLNIKLCDHCLIPCHFQYCDECNLIFNSSSRILYPITELPEPKEKKELLTKDMLFQEPNQTTKIEQYLMYSDLSKKLELKWYSNNDEGICPEKAHETNTGFDLRYLGQSSIIIALHSLIKIDLKITLEISVSTMIQVAFKSSLAKKKINKKEGIINAKYMENIIVMLQNNSDKSYKIKSYKKIAQVIFLSLIKISQLAPVTTQEELGFTAQGIKGFGSIDQKIQNQALVFEANPEICSLTNIANLYVPAKAYKHFKIPIHNLTKDIIKIPEGTLIGSISSDIQNSEKP
ncbi:hypothetical protein G9A89_005596 [Geosiphon pyriformis]|nr:hypothetical protein G9A89_005596 [Geosiphon pyriformis]